MRKDLDKLTALGRNVQAAGDYDPSVLDSFENQHPERDYWVTFTCPEFTTLCPKTGQPDFATLTIRYIPGKRLVESKSLKLYLFGFRNHGDFHEDVVNVVYDDIWRAKGSCLNNIWYTIPRSPGMCSERTARPERPFPGGPAAARLK